MPSQRRGRMITILVFVIVLLTYYYSVRAINNRGKSGERANDHALRPGEGRSVQNQQFYRSTLEAMRAKEAARHLATKEKIQEAMARPQAVHGGHEKAEKVAVPVVKEKGSDEQDTEEVSIAGRTKMTVPKKGSQDSSNAELDPSSFAHPSSEEQKEAEDRKAREAEAKSELNYILKQAPVIIFSKSYCPHSKRAKTILLEGYEISPKPYVVELDQHRLGADLQSLLAETTGVAPCRTFS
ncbi:hypothetical protein N7470_007404 [Penicillium chermesinum]|nr:hypothetical protein N7470_007404 [Penicillium chermesinum]